MNKNTRGFTLVEIIIAMAVLAIMSLLICTLYTFLDGLIIKSNSMNQKVDTQVAYYEKTTADPYEKIDSHQTIFFNGVAVDINVKTIEGNKSDPNANPNIKYFERN